jgi:hypothetical protein
MRGGTTFAIGGGFAIGLWRRFSEYEKLIQGPKTLRKNDVQGIDDGDWFQKSEAHRDRQFSPSFGAR